MKTPLDIFGTATVTVIHILRDPVGKPVEASAQDITGCMVVRANRLVKGQDGADVVSSVQVAAPRAALAAFEDVGQEITVEVEGKRHAVISVEAATIPAPFLPDHVVVNLQ